MAKEVKKETKKAKEKKVTAKKAVKKETKIEIKKEKKVAKKKETKVEVKKEAKAEKKVSKKDDKKVEKTDDKKEVKGGKKAKRKVEKGVATILATFNNTIITLADTDGATLVQSSPPVVGFKGSKRSTAYAATTAAVDAAEKAIKKYGLREVIVYVKGAGAGRNAAVKGLDAAGIKITKLIDTTPLPHNGCRARKAPRN